MPLPYDAKGPSSSEELLVSCRGFCGQVLRIATRSIPLIAVVLIVGLRFRDAAREREPDRREYERSPVQVACPRCVSRRSATPPESQ